MSSHAILIDEIAELKRQVADWHKLADERSAALCTSRAEVERLEKALREAYVKLSDGIRDAEDEVGDPGGECDPLAEAANDAYNILNAALSAQPVPEKPALYPECPECGGTSWELDTSGSVTRHCADCGAEIQPFSADELARSEKVVKRVMLTITAQPAPEKPAASVADVVRRLDDIASDMGLEEGGSVARVIQSVADEFRPAERLTPHGRIIHEKNTIDVSGFPYPPETLDNEPAQPAGGGA